MNTETKIEQLKTNVQKQRQTTQRTDGQIYIDLVKEPKMAKTYLGSQNVDETHIHQIFRKN